MANPRLTAKHSRETKPQDVPHECGPKSTWQLCMHHHASIPVAGRHDSARLPACFRGLGTENLPQHAMGWATCTCAEKQVSISGDPQPQDPPQFVSGELALHEAAPCLASRGGSSACTAGRAQGKGQGTSLTPLPLCDVCMVIGRGGLRHGQAGAVGGGGGAFCNACRARFSRGGHRAPSTGIGTCFGGQCRSTISFPLCLGHETEVTVVPGQMPKTKDELPLGGTQTAVTHSCFLCDLLATQVARDGRPGCIAHCRPRR